MAVTSNSARPAAIAAFSYALQLMDKAWRRFILGCLLSAVLALPICYLIYQIFQLLGYVDPKEAPGILRSVALIVFVLIWLVVFRLATGDAYDELERRQKDKKKRGQ